MKKLFITLLLLVAFIPAKAQEADSAIWVVNRYIQKLNIDAFPMDTMLYMKSIIVNQSNPTDTTIMMRWYAIPNRFRTEIWAGDTLQMGAYGDGTDFFLVYDVKAHLWKDVHPGAFYEVNQSYDLRGPLYRWNEKGVELKYQGQKLFEGNPVYQVSVQAPGIFDREYFFEKNSGLFFIYDEKTTTLGGEELDPNRHVDWRACHEYIPINNMIFPTVESYQTNGSVIIIHNYPQLLPFDINVFMRDQRP